MTNREILNEVFTEYFGEEHVDFQENGIILVYFPKVTVTNEHDRSIEITKLFVKILVDDDCRLRGTFTMNRSEYTKDQFLSGYMHSHVSGIPARMGNAETFGVPCLGSGPLVATCCTLNNEFNEDFWRLFCRELSLYVTRESIEGVPHKYLESVGTSSSAWVPMTLFTGTPYILGTHEGWKVDSLVTEFCKSLFEDMPLKFNYIDGSYGVALSPLEWHITISNLFIDWFNKTKPDDRVSKYLTRSKIDGMTLYTLRESYDGTPSDYCGQHIGKRVCTFKGKEIKLEITGLEETNIDENVTLTLHPEIAVIILERILKVMNFGHGHLCKQYNYANHSTFTTKINETVVFL